VVEAIEAAAAGMIWIPSASQQKVNTQWKETALEQLTTRETEIVRQVAMGLANTAVAQKLSITESTVKIHLSNIFEKLDIPHRVQLTLYAPRRGLITISDQGR
jgi:DNA-binding NarL/FixJ family response regulator